MVKIEPKIAIETRDKIDGLLLSGLANPNSVIQIRYFEVACKLALISAEICSIVEPVL